MHSTDIINDGYEGSGQWPTYYVKKHGSGILNKEILFTFSTREEAAAKERVIVNETLLKNKNCMNKIIGGSGFTSEMASLVNKGRTKKNDQGRRNAVEKITGRTKATHEYLREMGLKNSKHLTGRTKESHEYIAEVSKKLTGRIKETHAGVAAMSKKLTGRTKCNHSGVRTRSDKLTGRTKETHAGVASQAAKMSGRSADTHKGIANRVTQIRKISEQQELEIYNLRLLGNTITEIQITLELSHVHYSTIVAASKRGKYRLEKGL